MFAESNIFCPCRLSLGLNRYTITWTMKPTWRRKEIAGSGFRWEHVIGAQPPDVWFMILSCVLVAQLPWDSWRCVSSLLQELSLIHI